MSQLARSLVPGWAKLRRCENINSTMEFKTIQWNREKLYEEITHQGENFVPTVHQKIFRFLSRPLALDQLRKILLGLRESLHNTEPGELKLLLHESVPDYSPYLTPKEPPFPSASPLAPFARHEQASLTA